MDSNNDEKSKGHHLPRRYGAVGAWFAYSPSNTSSANDRYIRRLQQQNTAGMICTLLTLICILLLSSTNPPTAATPLGPPCSSSSKQQTSNNNNNKFRGAQYWKEGVTQSVQTLWESEFARFQIHSIQLTSGSIDSDADDPSSSSITTIDDWLWYDESDNVNVLVQEEEEDDKGDFIVLQQTKYAIPGVTLAVIGGLIEKDKSPLQAAQRRLQEELGMIATEWISLGSFVAAANRGGGTTHVFWAKKATSNSIRGHKRNGGNDNDSNSNNNNHIAQGELERQDVVRLTRAQLVEALLAGKFREIKWTATVALALLQDQLLVEKK
jgi:ADP-ribose pyrophosphatase YjhB (NUDIX family)